MTIAAGSSGQLVRALETTIASRAVNSSVPKTSRTSSSRLQPLAQARRCPQRSSRAKSTNAAAPHQSRNPVKRTAVNTNRMDAPSRKKRTARV